MILAGDAGGTKTRLALYEQRNGALVRTLVEQVPSSSGGSLAEIVQGFLTPKKVTVTVGCIGIPGPVVNGKVKTTNLPWEIDEVELAAAVKVPKIKLVNDLVATTAAIPHLADDGVITLHAGTGRQERGVAAVLAPGTGTGQGYLCWTGTRYEAFASEGGHIDFAPTTPIEDELLIHLRQKIKGRVSIERVLCGPGIYNIYQFLRDSGRAPESAELAERMKKENPGAVISQAGLSGESDLCVKTLDLFAAILGAHAGNMVLTYMATGGLFLGGGIPPKLATKLAEGITVKSYLDKGRLSAVVKQTPLSIIKDDHAALLGCASIASHL